MFPQRQWWRQRHGGDNNNRLQGGWWWQKRTKRCTQKGNVIYISLVLLDNVFFSFFLRKKTIILLNQRKGDISKNKMFSATLVRTKYKTYGPWIALGSQSICSGLEDFLLWVILGREAQNNAQLVFTLSLSSL